MATMELHKGGADDSRSVCKILETLRAPFCIVVIDQTDEGADDDGMCPANYLACLVPYSDTLEDEIDDDCIDDLQVSEQSLAIGEGDTEDAAVDNLATVLVRRFTEIAADLSKKFALEPKAGA